VTVRLQHQPIRWRGVPYPRSLPAERQSGKLRRQFAPNSRLRLYVAELGGIGYIGSQELLLVLTSSRHPD
jgi:hypothetical protein